MRIRSFLACLVLLAFGGLCPGSGQASEPAFEQDIKNFEAADVKNPPQPGGIVFVGSSSIVRWSTLKSDFPELNVINRGFGGSVVSDSVRYARRIVTKYKPHMVVFFAGTNDLAAGKEPKTVIQDFASFLGIVKHDLPAAKVVFLSITPAPSRQKLWPSMQEVNKAVKAMAAKDKALVFVDFFDQFLTKDRGPRPELFVEDQLHMSPKGYEIWAKGLQSVVK